LNRKNSWNKSKLYCCWGWISRRRRST